VTRAGSGIETRPVFDYEERSAFQRRYAELAPLPPKKAKRLDSLLAEHEALLGAWQEADDDTERPSRLDKLEAQIEALEDPEEIWPAETLSIAGAVITVGSNGKAHVERGLIRPEDMPAKKATAAATAEDSPDDAEERSAFSTALIESLTAQHSAALAASLTERSDVALAAVVHAFACRILLEERSKVSSLEVTLNHWRVSKVPRPS
jgi:ParB family chromosome partitioning protein